ncbi:hypothetical protein PMZ80_007152 [Knufia obscura]|uniref:Heterokaryon incompatibility domain-containing protein n=1 Tax=Knufia obscura TaxID=1635080 RepID=A0ABR0RJD9_9EURO|nr:hypothetical protein PMZ80_007152 [Knufia obscura]
MTSSSEYRHVPLAEPRNIRVLDVEPASATSTELRCKLRQVSLEAVPLAKYSALSYCWGGQIPDHPVLCDGALLNITKNCLDAIMKLRRPQDTITLWIDSICIDQKNMAEKSTQVALMGEIYKHADQVIVWLGEWDDTLRKAVEVVKDIGTVEYSGEPTPEQGLLGQRQMQDKVKALKAATRHPSDDVLGPLYHKAWFGRMWTVQEVALARGNNILVYNGPDSSDQLPWNVLILATDALLVCHYDWIDLSRTVKLHKQLLTMIIMERWPVMKEVYKMKPGDLVHDPMVWTIMCDAREKEATNVKDKVFALYGVFQELKIAPALPSPDYSKSIEDIYRELTVAGIESDKHLYVLYDAPSDHRHLRPGLASWVPDWSDPGWRGRGNMDSRIAVSRDRFCAAGPADPSWKFSADGRQLLLRGKIIDEIIFCGQPLCCLADSNIVAQLTNPRDSASRNTAAEEYKDDLREAYTTLKSWVQICSWYDKYPTTGETAAQAFCRTLTQDFGVEDNNNPESKLEASNAWFRTMSSSNPDVEVFRAVHGDRLGARKNDDTLIEYVIRESPPAMLPLAAIQMKPGGSFHSAARTFSTRKGFFITEAGRMGTAAARVEAGQGEPRRAVNLVEAGDQIAVLAGLEMPLVLRPVNIGDGKGAIGDEQKGKRVYRLVTHAYVHGIMYGEVWEDKSRPLEEIILV